MSRYRKVLTKIWEDDKFPYLHPEHQRLFLYHLTSPRSTPFLLYIEGPGAVGDALRMPSGRLREGMIDLAEKGMVWYSDDGSNFLCVPQALTIPENAPQSPNELKSWVRIYADLPRTPFRDRVLNHWLSLGVGIAHGLAHAFVDRCHKSSPTSESRRVGESESRIITTLSGSHPTSRHLTNEHEPNRELRAHARTILTFLNEKAGRSFRPVDATLRPIEARLRAGATVEDCRGVVARKVRDWRGDPKMVKFLRPETLFNATKFESYLGEKEPE